MRPLTATLSLALLLSRAPLGAQGLDDRERQEAARAELIAQAEAASDAGDHARALELATRAQAIRATPSLRLLLATEHAALEHAVEAYELATRCAREAQADPATRNREQVIEACTSLSRTLDARIGRVTVELASPPPGARVRVGGSELSQALWGIPYAVAPGTVEVEATADGHAPFRQQVSVTAGQNVPVRVALTPAATSAPSQILPPAASPVSPSPPPPRAPSLVGPLVVGGVAVASLALAGVFFGLRQGAVADRDAQCSRAGCHPSALEHDASARGYNTATNVLLGVGAAAAVGAGVWLLVGRMSAGPARQASLHGSITPLERGALVGLGGAL